jgi:hypothetical protein
LLQITSSYTDIRDLVIVLEAWVLGGPRTGSENPSFWAVLETMRRPQMKFDAPGCDFDSGCMSHHARAPAPSQPMMGTSICTNPSPRGGPGVPSGYWGGASANHDFKIQTCCMEFQIPKLSNHIGKCSMCDFYHRNSYLIYLRFVSENIKILRILETMRLLIGRDSASKRLGIC